MSRRFALRISLFGSLALGSVGFLGGCGEGEPPPPTAENVKARDQMDQDRMKNMEDQYKNKKSTPSK
jgi:hypothetical protein